MMALMQDRQLLQDRLKHVLATVSEMAEVDHTQITAVGFCFGGLCTLDLARTGEAVLAVASFHGVLKATGLKRIAISAKVIVFHDGMILSPRRTMLSRWQESCLSVMPTGRYTLMATQRTGGTGLVVATGLARGAAKQLCFALECLAPAPSAGTAMSLPASQSRRSYVQL